MAKKESIRESKDKKEYHFEYLYTITYVYDSDHSEKFYWNVIARDGVKAITKYFEYLKSKGDLKVVILDVKDVIYLGGSRDREIYKIFKEQEIEIAKYGYESEIKTDETKTDR